MPQRTHHQQSRFSTTHWSVVLRAGGDDTEESRQALGRLIETYWYPLYAYSRRSGNNDHDAMDLTQGFFEHLLRGQGLDSASPSKGRFRSFLLTAFKNYTANERRAAGALRRGGGVTTFSLSGADFQTRYDRQPLDEESPDRLFDRSWVEALLKRVRDQLAGDYQRSKKQELFELLEPHLTHHADATPRAEICRQLNLSTAAVAMSLHRMRRRYGELLREEVAATLNEDGDVEAELRALMEIVSHTR